MNKTPYSEKEERLLWLNGWTKKSIYLNEIESSSDLFKPGYSKHSITSEKKRGNV